jgi:hypothetical protein
MRHNPELYLTASNFVGRYGVWRVSKGVVLMVAAGPVRRASIDRVFRYRRVAFEG